MRFARGFLDKLGMTSQMGRMSLTFDQFKQDQVLQLSIEEESGRQWYGVALWDRPRTSLTEDIEMMSRIENTSDEAERQRVTEEMQASHSVRGFFGKAPDGSVTMYLNDSVGQKRFEVAVDTDDTLSIRSHDKDGNAKDHLIS